MFQKKFVEKIGTYFFYSIILLQIRSVEQMVCKMAVEQNKLQTAIQYNIEKMRFAFWINKVTDTH